MQGSSGRRRTSHEGVTAASLWIAMNLCSFFLESWSDGLPDP